ncbi:SUMO-activating enzyme subunit 1 [Prorops nasuta]|uniref:SUMO-activating enzyme subunit 1 n=1 Tax=Prorops nasuta TaxID=863751 RepID=UPI0034CF66FF
MKHKMEENNTLSDAEAELYDRQIRLWGVESQKRLRSAKVLLIGANGFAAETAKNIILAGVKSVTFLDHRNLSIEDTCSQFLAPKTEIGKNRAQASLQRAQNLNPMVKVTAETENVNDKSDKYFADFDVVCATQCDIFQLQKINNACREHNIKFFAGDVWGTIGFTFADLKTHEFVEDVIQSKKVCVPEGGDPIKKEKFENITVTVKRTENFVPFNQILGLDELPKDSEIYYIILALWKYRSKYGQDPLPDQRNRDELKREIEGIITYHKLGDKLNYYLDCDLYAQVSPVCAILGGIMGQEIIKAVSQKEAPHNNLFIFNPETLCGKILKLGY